jgi:hypothetical protein
LYMSIKTVKVNEIDYITGDNDENYC